MCRNGGTTTSQMARWLAARPVRVVTNSLLIAHEIECQRMDAQGAEVFLTGGYLYPGSGLLVGPETVESVRRYRAVTAFLSVGGITEEGFATNQRNHVENTCDQSSKDQAYPSAARNGGTCQHLPLSFR